MIKGVFKIFLNLLGLALLFVQLEGAAPVKIVKISFFPDEDAFVKYDYSLGKMGSFDFLNNEIYYCSGDLHEVFNIDLSGKLLRKFGRKGQGPGEFIGPSSLRISADHIYIYDTGNGRFQIFSLDGIYERQFKIPIKVYDYKISSGQLFVLKSNPQPNDQNVIYPISIYGNEGEKDKEISAAPFKQIKNNDELKANNVLSIQIYKNQIHCLQKYGTNYRIYDLQGKLMKDFDLEINPISLPERKNMKGWLWAFHAFCVDDDRIYASCALTGNVSIYVFDLDGRLLEIYRSPLSPDEKYACDELRAVTINGKKYLLMLFRLPDCNFGMFEVD